MFRGHSSAFEERLCHYRNFKTTAVAHLNTQGLPKQLAMQCVFILVVLVLRHEFAYNPCWFTLMYRAALGWK